MYIPQEAPLFVLTCSYPCRKRIVFLAVTGYTVRFDLYGFWATTIYYTDALHLVANVQGSVSFFNNTLVMTEEETSSHEERTVYENGREELPCGS